ncbi:MAG: flagellar basal body P-ring formation protein FlgA [Caulobacteraceae bacterium]|nr:flagellar basal body P-ring formation chaperone FlgA [Caulobacter sp.]RYF95096.1 MAG: flagellar basal body P-ring formation protein FlgA [Caulobacteraceae bacterium]
MRALLLSAVAALVFAAPAFAGPVTLRAEVSDADGRVTLGDLFEGAGGAAGILIANRAGPSVVLDAQAVQVMARRAGLQWDNPQGFRRIVVRAGGGGSAAAGPVAARGNVDVLTYARSLSVGEIVQPQDLVWAKAAGAPADAPRDADQIIGLAARRPLREGAPVAGRDVSAPLVIKAGESVNVTWSDGFVTLTMQGKALKAAATGESFNLQNPTSKKIIEAIATGPGEAAAGPQAQALKSAAASSYAAR